MAIRPLAGAMAKQNFRGEKRSNETHESSTDPDLGATRLEMLKRVIVGQQRVRGELEPTLSAVTTSLGSLRRSGKFFAAAPRRLPGDRF